MIAEDHPMKALRHELRLHRLCEEILLDPFSEQELADYVAGRLGGADGSDAFVQALHRHTDGLPLFVANIIDELLAQGALQAGALARDAQLTFNALSVPESLAGVMERQIARLPGDQTRCWRPPAPAGSNSGPLSWRRCSGGTSTGWRSNATCWRVGSSGWRRPRWQRGADGDLEAATPSVMRWFGTCFTTAWARWREPSCTAVWRWRWRAAAPGAAVSAAELATQFELGQDPDAALPHCAAAAAGALQQFAPADALRLADRGLALARRCRSGAPVQELLATLHTLRGAAAAASAGRQRGRDLAVVRAGAGRHGGLAAASAAQHGAARTGAWAVPARRTSRRRASWPSAAWRRRCSAAIRC